MNLLRKKNMLDAHHHIKYGNNFGGGGNLIFVNPRGQIAKIYININLQKFTLNIKNSRQFIQFCFITTSGFQKSLLLPITGHVFTVIYMLSWWVEKQKRTAPGHVAAW